MTEPRRRRHGGWIDPDSPDDDLDEQLAPAPAEGLEMTSMALVFNDRLIVPVPGQDQPIAITQTPSQVPNDLVELVRTAAADSHVPLRETP